MNANAKHIQILLDRINRGESCFKIAKTLDKSKNICYNVIKKRGDNGVKKL